MTGKRHTEAATLAGVVVNKLRLRIHNAVPRCREEQARAVIGLALFLRGRAVALVEPRREHRAVGIERKRLEPLADIVGRDRPDRREGRPAICRTRGEDLAVKCLVAERRERHDQVTVLVDYDLRPRIRAPVHVELLIGDGDRLGEIPPAISRVRYRDLAASEHRDPQLAVWSERGRYLGCTGQRDISATGLRCGLVHVMRRCRRLTKQQRDSGDLVHECLFHRNATFMPAMNARGDPA